MTELRVSYTLDSTLETVDSAEQTASRIAAESGFDEDVVMQISMAVREAAVNAVLHGNAYDPEKKVKLDFERTGNDLVITIRSGQRVRSGQDSRSAGSGESFEDFGTGNFFNSLVHGRGANPSVPDGHRN